MKTLLATTLAAVFSLSAFAVTTDTVNAKKPSTVLGKGDVSLHFQNVLNATGQPIDVIAVEDAPIQGFYQVVTGKGVFYVSKDGQHMMSGSLRKMEPGIPDLTALRMAKVHKEKIDTLKNDFITYRAPNEKHEILVFYDTTCGYCQKLHNDIARYNALGITVHYAAFPRNGVENFRAPGQKTEGYQQLENIWCAENKNLAFNMSLRNGPMPSAQCESTVAQQYELGVTLVVEGTPAIFGMDVRLIVPGYVPPGALLDRLETGA